MRQLYGSVAGNSGDIFFATCFRQFMIFCAKFYFSAQMATMAIGNANPDILYLTDFRYLLAVSAVVGHGAVLAALLLKESARE